MPITSLSLFPPSRLRTIFIRRERSHERSNTAITFQLAIFWPTRIRYSTTVKPIDIRSTRQTVCNNILHAGVNHSFENTGINLATAQKSSTLSPSVADARRVKMKTAVSDNHVLMYHRINLAAIADHSNVCSVIAPLRSIVSKGGQKFTPSSEGFSNYSTQLFGWHDSLVIRI